MTCATEIGQREAVGSVTATEPALAARPTGIDTGSTGGVAMIAKTARFSGMSPRSCRPQPVPPRPALENESPAEQAQARDGLRQPAAAG